LLTGTLSTPTMVGHALAQIDPAPGGASSEGSDPLLDTYRRLYGPGRMLAQQTPAMDRSAAAATAPEEDEKTSMQELNKQLINPACSIGSRPLQTTSVISTGWPSHRERCSYNLNSQPVLPLHLTENWNLISRPVFPVFAGVDVPQVSGRQLEWNEKSGF